MCRIFNGLFPSISHPYCTNCRFPFSTASGRRSGINPTPSRLHCLPRFPSISQGTMINAAAAMRPPYAFISAQSAQHSPYSFGIFDALDHTCGYRACIEGRPVENHVHSQVCSPPSSLFFLLRFCVRPPHLRLCETAVHAFASGVLLFPL